MLDEKTQLTWYFRITKNWKKFTCSVKNGITYSALVVISCSGNPTLERIKTTKTCNN